MIELYPQLLKLYNQIDSRFRGAEMVDIFAPWGDYIQ